MHALHLPAVSAALATVIVLSCGSEVTQEGAEGGAAGAGGTGGAAGAGGHDPVAGAGGAAGGTGAAGGAGGAPTCLVTHCQGTLNPCGDCLDNDGDEQVDMADPECTGPCDLSEDSFHSYMPGCDAAACMWDCYFDRDCLQSDDLCFWSHHCDPLEVPPDYYPEPHEEEDCAYDPNTVHPYNGQTCAELSAAQSPQCLESCGPLTPNGCDCFGCCQYPAGSSSYFFLGSLGQGGMTVCTSDKLGDPTVCHPCTPVPGCLNPCDTCELCLTKTELPPSCGGQQVCPPGAQPCGLDGQPLCPEGFFCLTGCCAKAPI